MRTALDTNILSAILTGEPVAQAVTIRLHSFSEIGPLIASPVVFAELSAAPGMTRERTVGLLAELGITLEWELGEAVWALAAERYGWYAARRRKAGGGESKRLLADFLVGAHALATASQLYTLDKRRYQPDFPELRLVLP